MSVDATVAGASSDVYADVDAADAYVAEVASTGDASTWGDLTDGGKENFLKRATRIIDRYFYDGLGRYDTSTVTAGQQNGQALEFPRASDLDGLGDPYLIPEVVECCCAVALALATGTPEFTSGSDGSVKQLKAGAMTVDFDEGVEASSTDDIVRDLLSFRMVHGVRTV